MHSFGSSTPARGHRRRPGPSGWRSGKLHTCGGTPYTPPRGAGCRCAKLHTCGGTPPLGAPTARPTREAPHLLGDTPRNADIVGVLVFW